MNRAKHFTIGVIIACVGVSLNGCALLSGEKNQKEAYKATAEINAQQNATMREKTVTSRPYYIKVRVYKPKEEPKK